MRPVLKPTRDWQAGIKADIVAAIAAFEDGADARARHLFEKVLETELNVPEAHLGLAFLQRPGPDYLDWLACLHEALSPKIYVEIGVETGASLRLARYGCYAIGIDPVPQIPDGTDFEATTRIETMTSRDFFSGGILSETLENIDLAFIDGDHAFASCLQDFIALEKRMAPQGVIAIHDTWPLTSGTASPVRQTGFYTGDCWKILPCLRLLRPDLHLITLKAPPSGLTLVTGLDPESRLLSDRLADISEAYHDLDYRPDHEQMLMLRDNGRESLDTFLRRVTDIGQMA